MSSGTVVEYARMLDLLAVEGQLLTAATHDAPADALVTGATRRTLGQTVQDLGDFCEDALSWLGVLPSATRDWGLPEHASLREVTSRFTARFADLLAEFGTRPADDRCPTWWPEANTVSFWLRRALHATIVCRVDVQAAAGIEMTPIDAEVARDGIDEALRVWLGYRSAALGITASRPCSVGISIAEDNWLVSATEHETAVSRQETLSETEVNAVVTGDPATVYLWLWGRLPDRAVHTAGDQDAIAQLWGLLRLATQ